MRKCLLLLAFIIVMIQCNSQSFFGNTEVLFTSLNNSEIDKVIVSDLNIDGRDDIIFSEYDEGKISWLENLGEGNFSVSKIITDAASNILVTMCIDLDEDGLPDIVSSEVGVGKGVFWYKNLGNGAYSEEMEIYTPPSSFMDIRRISCADLDSDQDLDIIMGVDHYSNGYVAWFRNDGNGIFTLGEKLFFQFEFFKQLCVSDVDNDADNDIIMGNEYGDGISWLKNSGSEIFDERVFIPETGSVVDFLPFDVDEDTDEDLVYVKSDQLHIKKNDGSGNYIESQAIQVGYGLQIKMFDLDNDDDEDFIVETSWDDIFMVINTGIGGFGEKITVDYTAAVNDFYAIDIDEDGDKDILYADGEQLKWVESHFNHTWTNDVGMCASDSIWIDDQWIKTAGSYYDTLTNYFGGDSMLVYNVSILPQPNPFDISGPEEVADNSIVTYTVPINNEVTYNFDVEFGVISDSGENFVEVQWGENVVGIVRATAAFPDSGCTTERMIEVIVGESSVGENQFSNSIICPNPATDLLKINCDVSGWNASIYDLRGQKWISSGSSEIDVSDLPANIYLVSFFDRNNSLFHIEKVVITH